MPVCRICGEVAKHECGRCAKAYYCSTEHQRADWRASIGHGTECRPRRVCVQCNRVTDAPLHVAHPDAIGVPLCVDKCVGSYDWIHFDRSVAWAQDERLKRVASAVRTNADNGVVSIRAPLVQLVAANGTTRPSDDETSGDRKRRAPEGAVSPFTSAQSSFLHSLNDDELGVVLQFMGPTQWALLLCGADYNGLNTTDRINVTPQSVYPAPATASAEWNRFWQWSLGNGRWIRQLVMAQTPAQWLEWERIHSTGDPSTHGKGLVPNDYWQLEMLKWLQRHLPSLSADSDQATAVAVLTRKLFLVGATARCVFASQQGGPFYTDWRAELGALLEAAVSDPDLLRVGSVGDPLMAFGPRIWYGYPDSDAEDPAGNVLSEACLAATWLGQRRAIMAVTRLPYVNPAARMFEPNDALSVAVRLDDSEMFDALLSATDINLAVDSFSVIPTLMRARRWNMLETLMLSPALGRSAAPDVSFSLPSIIASYLPDDTPPQTLRRIVTSDQLRAVLALPSGRYRGPIRVAARTANLDLLQLIDDMDRMSPTQLWGVVTHAMDARRSETLRWVLYRPQFTVDDSLGRDNASRVLGRAISDGNTVALDMLLEDGRFDPRRLDWLPEWMSSPEANAAVVATLRQDPRVAK